MDERGGELAEPSAADGPSVVPPERVGTLPGVATASFGSAEYAIPLQHPPTAGQLDAGLSIRYDSHVGDGFMGLGFRLDGLSKISRCAKPVVDYEYLPGFPTGVVSAYSGAEGYFDFASSSLCIDGERLLLVSGEEGADGAEYRARTSPNYRVLQHGDLTSTDVWFEASAGNGISERFGSTEESRRLRDIPSFPTTRTFAYEWHLSESEDRFQNRILYSYEKDSTVIETTEGSYPADVDVRPSQLRFEHKGVTGARIVFRYAERRMRRHIRHI